MINGQAVMHYSRHRPTASMAYVHVEMCIISGSIARIALLAHRPFC